MGGTRMEEVLEKVFGSVLKMLTNKKYAQCVVALSLLIKELLCSILQDECTNSDNMLQEYLTEKIQKRQNHKTLG